MKCFMRLAGLAAVVAPMMAVNGYLTSIAGDPLNPALLCWCLLSGAIAGLVGVELGWYLESKV